MGFWEGFNKTLLRVFKSRNERVLRAIAPIVVEVASFEPRLQQLSDSELAAKTPELRNRLADGATLDALLPEAFACVRESARRFLRTDQGVPMRHFDVQIIGGVVLHRGGIAEMVTGEGKTLVATLAAYLNALPERGVHVVTVNDYLARRDATWMQSVYAGLGVTVGAIQSSMSSEKRLEQYACDITYGTNSEFGFDYLRDNMKVRPEDQCQKRRCYAIVDEVDSILIDEARTPLIISGRAEEASDKYAVADRVARKLEKGRHFEVKEKEHSVVLTEEGIERAEALVGVDSFYSPANVQWPHHIEQALRAHHLYQKDVDYVVRDGAVIIVDEFTGRLMDGRRWSDGLHQAVEVKEGLKIKEENQTLATITYQNFFRLYDKLAGMTGTAMTEAAEFLQIYKLDVVAIPTNRPLRRASLPDVVYRTKREKWKAVAENIGTIHATGQPILVGTISIEASELLSDVLKRRGIHHSVLNAKYHEREAEIIAQAGQRDCVTIATNMAGRGTDIVLGPGVKDLGGLFVLGSERHEARRIDNQLRGRCGRQGDPGTSQFYLSLEDDLMRIFATERVSSILKRFGMDEGVDITHPWVTRAIERAQKKVEARNFEIRKSLLDYDEVMDHQRKLIYGLRTRILQSKDLPELLIENMRDVARERAAAFLPEDLKDDFEPAELNAWLRERYGFELPSNGYAPESKDEVIAAIAARYQKVLEERRGAAGAENFDKLLHFIMLQTIDEKWKDHLHEMDQLRSGIGMRSYAQVDPKVEYKREGYLMFAQVLLAFKERTAEIVPRVRVQIDERAEEQRLASRWQGSEVTPGDVSGQFQKHSEKMQQGISGSQAKGPAQPIRNAENKVGRNDPCPCGSGKKYKKCHGTG
ncbi:MAG: preprotein translocase subunit SecA [Planctomycetes bacterium]|nr:preprotein translocase subunit SecA [Planctomycetota bacterium]